MNNIDTVLEELPPHPAVNWAEITWAGPNPLFRGYCFGTETGEIIFSDADGRPVTKNLFSKSAEAINGMAFSQNWLAVTTRSDINFIGPFPSVGPSGSFPTEGLTLDWGGHDVITAPASGHFVIPLGPDGIMFVKPGTDEWVTSTNNNGGSSRLNFYRVLAIAGESGHDVIVSAGRSRGLGHTIFRDGIHGQTLHTITFPNLPDLDFVDVCSLATATRPFAVAAAAANGSLIFFEDIVAEKTPKVVRFKNVTGTACRLLRIGGDIYLLTTTGLFCLFNLAATVFSGSSVQEDGFRLPIDAADANTVDERWLVLVGADSVFRIDTEKLRKPPDESANGSNNGRREEPDRIDLSSREPISILAMRAHFEESKVEMAAVTVGSDE